MMKKFSAHISHWLPALAILALVACKKEPVNVSPDYDPETNTVTTKFFLNISTNSQKSTKMANDAVQINSAFRGMSDVHLLTYGLEYHCEHGEHYMYLVDDESSKATRDFDLGSLLASGEIDDTNSSRVVELAVPLDVNAVMLYGKATKTSTDAQQGATIASGTALGSTLENVSFKLKNRLQDAGAYNAMCYLLGEAMTLLVGSSLTAQTDFGKDTRYAFWWPIDDVSKDTENYPVRDTDGHPLYTDGTEKNGYTYHTGTKSWKDLGDQYTTDFNKLTPLGQILGKAFNELAYVRTKTDPTTAGTISELRAGATSSVLRMLKDLSELLDRAIKASTTSYQEEIDRQIAVEIARRIAFFFDGEGGAIKYKSMTNILKVAENFPKYEAEILPYYNNLTTKNGNYFPDDNGNGGFPVNLGLPKSAALMMSEVKNNKVIITYIKGVPSYGMGSDVLPIENYRYCPELMYWANSGIRTSDIAHDKLQFPNGVSNWADEDAWSGDWTKNGTINSTTRSIALMKQVNYGTALMESTIQVVPTIEDNKGGIFPGEANQVIDITGNPNAFEVTGIFIGGMSDEVGWDFIPKKGVAYDKMIYDEVNPTGENPYYANTGSGNTPIYTMTWDNYRPQLDNQNQYAGPGRQEDQVDVYVGIEFVNRTGQDLWAELNLIRNGGTFYLVGKLDLSKATDNVQFPNEAFFHYPPFYPTDTAVGSETKKAGETIAVKRVFMQDYLTKAKFTFGKNSLAHAYMTIPDLRANQISLGLSVDMTWEPGLDFTVVLGELND